MIRPAELTLANWDRGGEPSTWAFLHMGELFPAVEIPVDGTPIQLPVDERAVGEFPVDERRLDAYVVDAPVDAMIVVHEGTVIYERYPRMDPADRHLLMSVTKPVTSTLAGILEDRGELSVRTPVDALLPELAGSGWVGVPLIDVLDMASGIDCPEGWSEGAFDDPNHPLYQFEACLGWHEGPRRSAYDYVRSLGSAGPSGMVYDYTSVNTFVLSWVMERVTGLSYAEMLGRELWSRGGFESPAQLCVAPDGAPVSYGGLSLTLRDVARFGLLFTPSHDGSVVSRRQLARIQDGGRPDLLRRLPAEHRAACEHDGELPRYPSRQWNAVLPDGDLWKGGFGGQGLYVSPVRDLVIAWFGTPRADGSENAVRSFVRRLARSVGRSD